MNKQTKLVNNYLDDENYRDIKKHINSQRREEIIESMKKRNSDFIRRLQQLQES